MTAAQHAAMPKGIIAWGAYVPAFRLSRAAIADVHGGRGSGYRRHH
jgi:3-hydroxy-3-methylglutaryl CoA synthase